MDELTAVSKQEFFIRYNDILYTYYKYKNLYFVCYHKER